MKSKTSLLVKMLVASIEQEGLPAPVLEYRFDTKRKWRFDLAWPWVPLAVEIHGSVYTSGRHTRGKGFEDDREKMNAAVLQCWRVLEYSWGQVREGRVLLDLKRVLA